MMSLTEREKEIALECWNYYLANSSLFTIGDMFDHFLSCIREEQEAVAEVKEGHVANWLQWKSEELMSIIPIGTQLFTIPPASPDCKELVKAIEEAMEWNWLDDDMPSDVINEFDSLLAKYKASMGEK